MVLKFRDTPQTGNQGPSNPWPRLPQGAQPIATAPENSATPIVVYERNGQAHWALHHRGAWQKLSPKKDWRSGEVRWAMDGTQISNTVAWGIPRKK